MNDKIDLFCHGYMNYECYNHHRLNTNLIFVIAY